MCLESSGKPDAWKLARPVWGWGRGETPRPTPLAAAFGGWQDLAKSQGLGIEAPIASYSDFEHLEFKGQQQEQLAPFLDAMKALAEKQKVKSE